MIQQLSERLEIYLLRLYCCALQMSSKLVTGDHVIVVHLKYRKLAGDESFQDFYSVRVFGSQPSWASW